MEHVRIFGGCLVGKLQHHYVLMPPTAPEQNIISVIVVGWTPQSLQFNTSFFDLLHYWALVKLFVVWRIFACDRKMPTSSHSDADAGCFTRLFDFVRKRRRDKSSILGGPDVQCATSAVQAVKPVSRAEFQYQHQSCSLYRSLIRIDFSPIILQTWRAGLILAQIPMHWQKSHQRIPLLLNS